ncbi:thioredoxin-like [Paroedura picta]|uniref:thioredoxin-like n=1 Tax=Paroedura picta TaxID=143630 RepID=UPI0040569178
MEEGGANQNASAAVATEEEAAVAAAAPGVGSTNELGARAETMQSIGNLNDFQTQLRDAGPKLIVVDFSATWCGPCKMIKPFFHSLCEKYPDVLFIEIDVDDAQDVAAHCDVKCMPTFQFYKNNVKVHEFSGANKEKLEETIKRFK